MRVLGRLVASVPPEGSAATARSACLFAFSLGSVLLLSLGMLDASGRGSNLKSFRAESNSQIMNPW
jgi:hypothetical protein